MRSDIGVSIYECIKDFCSYIAMIWATQNVLSNLAITNDPICNGKKTELSTHGLGSKNSKYVIRKEFYFKNK